MNEKCTGGWYSREYRMANGICEKTKFYVPMDENGSAYSGRNKKRAIRRAEKNQTEAAHTAARKVNNAFRAGRDYFLTLTLDDAGLAVVEGKAGVTHEEDPDAVMAAMWHELELLIDRARKKCKKAGVVLKYLGVASDTNGKTGELVRPHLHIIVSKKAARIVAASWKYGEIKRKSKLYSAHHGDLTDLVEYMIRQARQIGNRKRYMPSRNLGEPWVSSPRPVKNPDAPLRLPKGCDFIWRSEQRAGHTQRLRYYRPPKGGTDDG